MRPSFSFLAGAAALLSLVPSLPSAAAPRKDVDFEPLSPPRGLDAGKVALGKRLFSDPRLSADGTISCASCHDLERGGADPRRVSVGVGGKVGEVNSPTVFNSGLNFRQFWNGRAATLEEQIEGPITNPAEMANDFPTVIGKLSADEGYVRAFRAAYPDGITRKNVEDALASFERALVTPDAPFDRHLRGDAKALTAVQREGLRLFRELECTMCHDGPGLGGTSFQRFGAIGKPPFIKSGRAVTKADMGRYALTKDPKDLYRFKVPVLRNVALTAPYFHDGSAPTLAEAVRTMAEVQLGLTLTDDQTTALVAFLESLTGVRPQVLGRPLAARP